MSSNDLFDVDDVDVDGAENSITETSEYSVDIREIRGWRKSRAYKQTLRDFRSTLRSQLERAQARRFDSDDSADETTLEWLERLWGTRGGLPTIGGSAKRSGARREEDGGRLAVEQGAIPQITCVDPTSSTQTEVTSQCPRSMASSSTSMFEHSEDDVAFPSMVDGPQTFEMLSSARKDQTLTGKAAQCQSYDDQRKEGTLREKCVKEQKLQKVVQSGGQKQSVQMYRRKETNKTEKTNTTETFEMFDERREMSSNGKEKCRDRENRPFSSHLSPVRRKQLRNTLMSEDKGESGSCHSLLFSGSLNDISPTKPESQSSINHANHLPPALTGGIQNSVKDKEVASSNGQPVTPPSAATTTVDKRPVSEGVEKGRQGNTDTLLRPLTGKPPPVKMYGKIASGKRRILKTMPRKIRVRQTSSTSESEGDSRRNSFENMIRKFEQIDKANGAPTSSSTDSLASARRKMIRLVKMRKRSRESFKNNGGSACGSGDEETSAGQLPSRPKRFRQSDSDAMSAVTIQKFVRRVQKGVTTSTARMYIRKHRKRTFVSRENPRQKEIPVQDASLPEQIDGSVSASTQNQDIHQNTTSTSEKDDASHRTSILTSRFRIIGKCLGRLTLSRKSTQNTASDAADADQAAPISHSTTTVTTDHSNQIQPTPAATSQSPPVGVPPLLQRLQSAARRVRSVRHERPPSPPSSGAENIDDHPRFVKFPSKLTTLIWVGLILFVLAAAVAIRIVFYCKATDRCLRCDLELIAHRMIESHSAVYHTKPPPI
ncbi:uncharacterized protein [Diadema setosum]|uniref:uncharacterized protein n=1 Tax=Diadema setosum TaxID=31175 RepID=UPI003B3B6A96